MITTDEQGILLQAPIDINSADDSLCRTSIAAICGLVDKSVMNHWLKFGGLPPRHPYRHPSCYYEGFEGDRHTTRDQLVPYVSFLYLDGNFRIAELVRNAHKLLVNKDPLAPDIKWMFAKAANHWSQYLWAIIGIPWTLMSIIFSCIITPKHELNQLFCQSFVAGKWATRLICKLHPDWRSNLEQYWGVWGHGKWRQLPEIAEAMIQIIDNLD